MKFALSSLLWLAAPAFACGPFFPNTVLDQSEETLRAAPIANFAAEVERLASPAIPGLLMSTNEVSGPAPPDAAGYQRGADLWHAGQTNEARAAWLAYLQLPAPQRRSRTTWAAYMIGKSYLTTAPAKAVPWFQRTRALARQGFGDELGLAASSLGWEALAELRQGHHERAADLYLQHYASGDGGALISLRVVADRALGADPRDLIRYAQSVPLNRVITAYLVSGRGSVVSDRAWLVAVERGDVVNLAGADRLAWLAYQTGDFGCAARWLKRAPTTTPVGQWVRAKLLLRDGQVEDATALLARLVRQFPCTNDWDHAYRSSENWWEDHATPQQVASELAVLRMARGQFVDAMDLLVRHDYWTDAAYVAERVLTVDELARCSGTNTNLQYLLGRRLARLGRYAEARPFLPATLHPRLDELVAAQTNRNAATLWQAARTLRWYGLALTGTELGPDWFIHEGQYEQGFSNSNRLAHAGADEQHRVTQHADEAAPDKRFHYRYRAAELAWEAAALMPDNADETARVLHEAGTWLKDRDPQAADRFYKALVKRCGNTALGKRANSLRWFPDLNHDESLHLSPRPGSTELAEGGATLLAPVRSDPKAEANERGEYVIRVGDSLMKIARLFGLSVDEIMKLNPELDRTRLRVGQQLLLVRREQEKADREPVSSLSPLQTYRIEHHTLTTGQVMQVWLVSAKNPADRRLLYTHSRSVAVLVSGDEQWLAINDEAGSNLAQVLLFRQRQGLDYSQVEDLTDKAWQFVAAKMGRQKPPQLDHAYAEVLRWADDHTILLRLHGHRDRHDFIDDWLCLYDVIAKMFSTDLEQHNKRHTTLEAE